MREVLHVACAVEGRYVPHTAAMIRSVLAHSAPFEVRIHYMHGGDVSSRQAQALAGMVDALGGSIDFIEVPDERVEELPTKGFTGKATWYRIFLTDLLPDVDRALYLDADVIVVDDLAPLWATELGGSYLAAVTNVFEPWYAHRPAELGLAGPEVYFNAGVLLMNLGVMRTEGCSSRLLDNGVSNAADLLWRDQDALNVVLGERRLSLAPRWNCMNAVLLFDAAVEVFGAEAVEEARARPAIRHFEGPGQNKPWHYLADAASRDTYMRYRRDTPWPRVRRDGMTPRNVVTRLKRSRAR